MEIPDLERPLNDRGKRDAPAMARRLLKREIVPDFMISSNAKRCKSTAKRMAEVLEYDPNAIKFTKKLYHAEGETLLSVVRELKNKHKKVFLFGHNPGLTDFVNALLSEETEFDNLPTCSVTALEFSIDHWEQVTWGTAHLAFFDFPKNQEV